MNRARPLTPAERQESNNVLLRRQAAELDAVQAEHRQQRAALAESHAAALAVVLRRHRRELARLWAAQGRQAGPWLQRQPAAERLQLERRRGS